jgi:arsenite-transporting ATPase
MKPSQKPSSSRETRFLFFTGKGGVGKTSLACATAIRLADEGKKVLLISTDPASNLHDVLETELGPDIRKIKNLPGLSAVNINPAAAASAYRERVINPLKGLVDEAELKKTTEELSGACTTEIASFDAFARFVDEDKKESGFDHIIFDTAPSGHTLRLLELPAAWSEFALKNPSGATCLGPSSALNNSRERYQRVLNALRDWEKTCFYLVARADEHSLAEAARSGIEMLALGFSHQFLQINGVFKTSRSDDKLAMEFEKQMQKRLKSIPESLQKLPRQEFPLLPYNLLGLEKLRSLFDQNLQKRLISLEETKLEVRQSLPDLDELMEEICAGGNSNGLILTMGKGGVGKTLAASAIAVKLAERGHKVLLTTTDPAGHIRDFLGDLDSLPAGLETASIKPKEETQKYIAKIMARKGPALDEEGRKLLLEDLQSPCTEEVAVFHAFSNAISQSHRKFVVIDTAPTGHSLLLLDTTGTYHQETMRHIRMDADKVRTPLMSLQDKHLTKILLVALPETTPMHEAAALQEDLRRAGVEPFAWIINQSLSMLSDLKDPVLLGRAGAEIVIIRQIRENLAARTFGIPFMTADQLLPALLKKHHLQKAQ